MPGKAVPSLVSVILDPAASPDTRGRVSVTLPKEIGDWMAVQCRKYDMTLPEVVRAIVTAARRREERCGDHAGPVLLR